MKSNSLSKQKKKICNQTRYQKQKKKIYNQTRYQKEEEMQSNSNSLTHETLTSLKGLV